MKICVTGHRPNKMYGYDIYNKQWIELKEKFKKLLIENNCDEAITGIGDLHFFETERTEQGYYRSLDSDEVFEKYKDLENIVIEDIWQKYVPISQEGGE